MNYRKTGRPLTFGLLPNRPAMGERIATVAALLRDDRKHQTNGRNYHTAANGGYSQDFRKETM